MSAITPPTPNVNPHGSDADSEPIPMYDRLVLWMFALGFIVIGLIIFGDLVAAFFR